MFCRMFCRMGSSRGSREAVPFLFRPNSRSGEGIRQSLMGGEHGDKTV